MKVVVFTREDGSEVCVTTYADGVETMAERAGPNFTPRVWSAPVPGTVQPEYDYKTDRRIEDVLYGEVL